MPNLVEKFRAEVGFLWGGRGVKSPSHVTRTQIYPAEDRVKALATSPGEFLSENIAIQWDTTKVVGLFFSPKHCGSWGMFTMCHWEYGSFLDKLESLCHAVKTQVGVAFNKK